MECTNKLRQPPKHRLNARKPQSPYQSPQRKVSCSSGSSQVQEGRHKREEPELSSSSAPTNHLCLLPAWPGAVPPGEEQRLHYPDQALPEGRQGHGAESPGLGVRTLALGLALLPIMVRSLPSLSLGLLICQESSLLQITTSFQDDFSEF